MSKWEWGSIADKMGLGEFIRLCNRRFRDLGQRIGLMDSQRPYRTYEEFGAAGDGTRDDTAAVQRCWDAVAGTGMEALGTGTYKVTSTLTTAGAVRARGGSFAKAHTGDFATISASNCQFADLYADMQGSTYAGGRGFLCKTTSSDRLIMTNVVFENLYSHGVEWEVDAADDSRYTDCIFTVIAAQAGTAAAFYHTTSSSDTAARARHILNFNVDGSLTWLFRGGGTNDLFVANSYFVNIEWDDTMAGTQIVGSRFAMNLGTTTVKGARCVLVGNTFSGSVVLDTNLQSTSFVGNYLTGGTFTNNAAVGQVLVIHGTSGLSDQSQVSYFRAFRGAINRAATSSTGFIIGDVSASGASAALETEGTLNVIFGGNVIAGNQSGSSPASSGVYRMPNNTHVRARNAANSADVSLLTATTSDNVQVGGTNAAKVQLLNTSGNGWEVDGSQHLLPTVTDVYDLGSTSKKARTLYLSDDAIIRGVDYTWPSSNASGVLTNDGSGNLSWAAGGSGSGLTHPEVMARVSLGF